MIERQFGLSFVSAGVATTYNVCTPYVYGVKYRRVRPSRLGRETDDLSRLLNRDFGGFFCRLYYKRLTVNGAL